MFASRLLNEEKMPPKPDLSSHTLTHFLDRFVYRNAKAAASGPRGSSIMQPLSGGDSRGVLISSRATQNGQQPVNTEVFWRKKAEDVAVDEIFFHKYFSQIGKGKQAANKKKLAKTAEESDNEYEENEDEIWQALVDSRPEVEGGSDDSDMEMLDLDDSDAGSDLDSDEDGEQEDVIFNDSEGSVSAMDDVEAQFDSEDEAPSKIDELFEKELEKGQASNEKPETSRQKRKKMKNLPTFASAEDYAEMLENDEDEDL